MKDGVEVSVAASGDLLPREVVYVFIVRNHGSGGKL